MRRGEAKPISLQFVQGATDRHQRVLALAFERSYDTLRRIADLAGGAYEVHQLGMFDRVKVLVFVPRTCACGSTLEVGRPKIT
jgi:hypothetical protein